MMDELDYSKRNLIIFAISLAGVGIIMAIVFPF